MRVHRSPLQRLASRHNRLHYTLQCKVISGLCDIAQAPTLTDESKVRLQEVYDAVARLKSSMSERKNLGERYP